jgi:hypothetical protein
LAATILSVVVIDDDVFERAFGEAVRYNEEGEIVAIGGGRGAEGIPFTQAAFEVFADGPYAPPGAGLAGLELRGWGYRWIRLRRSRGT